MDNDDKTARSGATDGADGARATAGTVRALRRRQRKRPGRRPTFSREDVIQAAFEEGLLNFTLASVAARLDVAPSALYREFDSREELLVSAVKTLASGAAFSPSEPAGSWEDELRSYAGIIWKGCLDYPEFSHLIMLYPELFIHAEAMIDQWARRLVGLGIPGGKANALFALDFVGDLIISTAFMMYQLAQKNEAGQQRLEALQEKAREGINLFDPGSWTEQGLFPQKLDFVIQGLKAGLGVHAGTGQSGQKSKPGPVADV